MSIINPEIFKSPSDLEEANREVGWCITYRKLTPGEYRGFFEVEEALGCLLALEAHNASMDVNGSNSTGMFALLNIHSFGGAIHVNGQKVDVAAQLLLSPGKELDIVSSGPCRVDQIYIPYEVYGHLHDSDYFLDCTPLVPDTLYSFDAARALEIRKLTDAIRLFRDGGRNSSCGKPEQFLYSHLPVSIGSTHSALIPGTVVQAHHIQQLLRARRFMWKTLHLSLSIPEICRQVGLSQRTLERMFGEAFGMTPKHYLEISRFSRTHRQLRAASSDETSVWKVASAAGFKHPGRFSVGYATFFGESPKRTLLDSRGR